MKKVFLISLYSIGFLLLLSCSKQKAEVVEDAKISVELLEETELVSVVSRIAEIDGYDWEPEEALSDYLIEVDSIFAPFKEHEAVRFTKDSLYLDGFNWHYPMEVALHFNIVDGKIIKKDNVDEDADNYYDRITPEHEAKFFSLLEDFYNTSNFHQFFKEHQPFYNECIEAMKMVSDSVDLDWYKNFFGPRSGCSFKMYLGIIQGPANYAIHLKFDDGTQINNSVMGCCKRNEAGDIVYGVHYTLPVIIHEFNHSYCNPLNDEIWDQIKDKATELFNLDPEYYANQAYGSPLYLMNETFVEACVVRYLKDHNLELKRNTPEEYLERNEIRKKFLFIRPLEKALEERESKAEQYPTMNDFLPRYVETINNCTVPVLEN